MKLTLIQGKRISASEEVRSVWFLENFAYILNG